MKVKELIKQLQKLDQNLDILVASDAEGNDFNSLYEVTEQYYDGESLVDNEEADEVIVLWP